MIGNTQLSGVLAMQVIKGQVQAPLSWRLKNMLRWGYWHGLISVAIAKLITQLFAVTAITSKLYVKVIKANGQIVDYGMVGCRVVTTAGVNFIVDAFQNSVEVENLKYHALGTGSTAEASGDTALVTELTTEYTGNVRATGTTTEGASANIYRTVATNTLDGTPGAALREHGVFDQAATGGGTLLDRTVFAAITLSSGDSLQTTYELTFTAGS